jgi:hypothetical protein
VRFIKRSGKEHPRLSLILLDWGVRESFHLLHYLKEQTVPREDFEVILIEYYDTVSEPLKKFESEVDTWVLLEMPGDCYYHKHLMYNAGVVLSKGEVLLIGDSDAMVRPNFVETILTAFQHDPQIVYHMDEFRNVRRDFYPFNYPSFEEVLGDGCINNEDHKTKGIRDEIDPMHTRNYGACMCALRKDIVAIGGADEDLSYLGHICGPYDMTFRLMNAGRRLVWEQNEYLYHTWHPGSDGIDNYLGPHDGKNMSITAFQALCSGRIPPQIENEAIRRLRTDPRTGDDPSGLLDSLIDPTYPEAFDRRKFGTPAKQPAAPIAGPRPIYGSYRGYDVYRVDGCFYGAQPHVNIETIGLVEDERVVRGESFNQIREIIDSFDARLIETLGVCNICAVGKRIAVAPLALGHIDFRLQTDRENPHIVWVSTIGEARQIARLASAPTYAVRAATPQTAAPAPVEDTTHVEQRVSDLERHIVQVEHGLAGIYNSRTWRALTKMGGVFQKITGSTDNAG